ncbi:metallophosphoesterase family protein [Akkermansia sp. BIOML-A10]|uniref:metallophosphoesterase family protein n=1 Tax=Akkermansia sp. BIOML-A10 TaxID=2584566 RepID=UPI00122F29C7|nr:metallophosphoesterase family protein [Akkermansia sp. BIOML-A10]KAA3302290.1 metallophosphoesterase family protein [Akkermansia sp. BIOML-A10]
MKIVIFSDIHDRTDHLEPAMRQMHRQGCGHFIFLGDCTTPESFRLLLELTQGLPLDAVPGNNDYELPVMDQMAAASPAARLHPGHAVITRYGMNLSLSHYPKYAWQEVRKGHVDAALYGHTHQALQEMAGNCLIANPGELQGRTGRLGFGILDTDSRTMNLHTLDFKIP